MAKTQISITNFITCCKSLPGWKSIIVRAGHGVGKSELISQLADYFREKDFNNEGYPLIDRRLSQISEGDIVGLPELVDGVTRFAPPDWIMQACKEPVCLFLDELNRATPEVMQAAFQIVLDRQIQGHHLHPQTRVYAAVNTGAGYTVNEMDPALLDRFWAVDLDPTVAEWLSWAKDKGSIIQLIVDFIRINETFLDPGHDAEPGTVQPSRRSWTHLSKCLLANGIEEKPNDPLFYQLCLGFVGLECTIAFVDYAKNYKFDLTAEDIIETLVTKLQPLKKGKKKVESIDEMVEGITDEKDRAEKVIEVVRLIGKLDEEGNSIDPTKYNVEVIKRMESMGQERINALAEKVATYVKTKYANQKLSDVQGAGLAKFASMLPAEIRLVFWKELMSKGIDDLVLNQSIHRWMAAQLLNIFGVELGERGKNMVANIPAFLKQ